MSDGRPASRFKKRYEKDQEEEKRKEQEISLLKEDDQRQAECDIKREVQKLKQNVRIQGKSVMDKRINMLKNRKWIFNEDYPWF